MDFTLANTSQVYPVTWELVQSESGNESHFIIMNANLITILLWLTMYLPLTKVF